MSETPERTSLERLTVNLTPRAAAALATAMALTGDTKTDTVSRALQFYAYFSQIWDDDGEVLIRRHANAGLETIRVL
jgi:hypothetical protein